MRLDVYVAEYWPEHSRSQWQKYIKDGHVTVNGEVVTSPKYDISEDDFVKVQPPQKATFTDQSLPVLYEDENVTVINKPSGILTHAKGATLDEFTVAEFMRSRTTDAPEGNRPGIVHRLDRDTSGVIICARTPEAQSFLQRQFSFRKVKKTYIAIVDGEPKQPEAILRLPIERNPKAPATFRVGPSGKPAETSYKVLWSDGNHSILELRPLTGRTHQLRVHMAYLGVPIKNDRFYGNKKTGGRLALHAYKLEITIPAGIRKTFKAPLPPDFTALLPNIGVWHDLPL